MASVRLAVLLAGLLVAAACGGAVDHGLAQAVGARTDVLGDGRIEALPEGTLYIQFLEVPQPAEATLTHSHIAGFVYVLAGTHRLAIAGGETRELKGAEAAFVPALTNHTHTNPASIESLWYFISVRPITARAGVPPFPGQKEVYGTPDLPLVAGVGYTQSLRAITLQPNGRTAARRHGGVAAFFTVQGGVEARVKGSAPRLLSSGQGMNVLPDTPVQLRNEGNGKAMMLAYFLTAEGRPFSTDVDVAP